MPAVLHLKPEEIDTKEKRGKYTVSVIGCNQKGILYATAFAEAGFKVICTDADQTLVKHLAKGKTPFHDREIEAQLKSFLRRGQISVTSELKSAVSQSALVVMTFTAKMDAQKHPDYSEVENVCKQAGVALSQGSLFIYGGTAGLGFTEGVIKETLENASGFRVGEDFGFVYNPIQFSGSQLSGFIANQELKVAGVDRTSLESAANILEAITKKDVKQILGFKTAEAALLFTIARKDANLALANELAIFCESAGIDYFEALKLMEVNEYSFAPAVEAEEEDYGNEAYLLLESAENFDAKLRLPVLARKINEDTVRHAVNLTQDVLRSCGKTLRRARVAVLGAAEPKTSAIFVKMLEKKGAKVSLYDPLLPKNEITNMARMFKRSLKDAVEGTDCIVILTKQDRFKRLNLKKLRAVMKMPASIVDLTRVIDPEKVERKGFTYRGIGRGVEKK
jgi:UDP-N-acetyl-D-mannosaminuronic acid dehydrogenase